jgi:hypothetical protein
MKKMTIFDLVFRLKITQSSVLPMKKPYLFFTFFLILLISSPGRSQTDGRDDGFKPHGHPILTIYSNFNSRIDKNSDDAGFEIRRAYFGYIYQLAPHYEICLKLDIGSPNDASEYSLLRRFAYFKNAYLKYSQNRLTTSFGIIDVMQVDLQEKYWGHRYIEKSFMDEFGFGPRADLGWNIAYRFHERVHADFGFYNGEGYTKLQTDNAFRPGLGLTLFPIKNLVFRVYADYILQGVVQSTVSGFLGYRLPDRFTGGIEYNYQFNSRFYEGQDKYGYSVYAAYEFLKQWEVFARYDQLYSNVIEGGDYPWNLESDGSAFIGGVQYSPIRQVNIALNYQDWVPYAGNAGNLAFIYLNFEYKLH